MKAWLVILLIAQGQVTLSGQTPRATDVNLEKLIDEIFPVQDEDFNYEELYETYGQLLANPINLNSATEEQLQSLLVLNSAQIFDFLHYRKEHGPLFSLYELQVIPSFSESTVRLLAPFVLVEDQKQTGWKGLLGRVVREKNNYYVARIERTLETRAGFRDDASTSSQYLGSATKLYNRFRVSSIGDFSFGFTAEKDAGEKMQWRPGNNQFGFDFLSLHGQVQNKGKIKNLIVGDYQAQFGQGLTLGGGFGMGKGSETITALRRSNLGFVPYTSVAEFGFFRGAAMSLNVNRWLTINPFYSHSLRDARITVSQDDEVTQSISSLFLSGLHRTVNEMAARKELSEVNLGGVVQAKTEKLDAGIIVHRTIYSTPIERNPTAYNQFSFNGKSNTNMGAYWNYAFRNYSFFSEASHSVGAGTAVVAGLLASISQSFDISLLYRNFDRDFHSFYSNAIAESSTAQNEKGLYWGWKYKVSKKNSATGYVDLFQFPWLRFRSYRPSSGSEWMLRYNFNPSKTTLLFFQVRQEEKNRNLSEPRAQYTTANGIKTNYWINADYKVSVNLGFKTRAQFVNYQLGNNNSNGFALIQDINFDWRKFSVSARIALFDTDNYDTRLYVYERDAWLAFSIPAYQGIGTRRYLLVQYKVSPKVDLWFRWAATEYEDRDVIGSGGEEIEGNARNDFKLQFRIKF
jgi:Helix-hairpin-helix motif